MQIKRLEDQVGAHKRYVKMINRFITRLHLFCHSRKECIAANPRNKLYKRLQNLESLLPKMTDKTPFVSSPFVHTSINGKRVLLHKAVLVSQTSIRRQTSQSKYSVIKIDQLVKQLVHFRNHLDRYLLLMDNRQKSSIMRIISHYTRKPSFKRMKAENYKVGKIESQKNEKTSNLKTTKQSKLSNPTEVKNPIQSKLSNPTGVKNPMQSKLSNPTGEKKSMQSKLSNPTGVKKPIQSKLPNPTGVKKPIQKQEEMINDRKPTKTIQKTPKKINEQGNYNPYAEQELDIYIDSLLEDADLDLDLGEREDSNLS